MDVYTVVADSKRWKGPSHALMCIISGILLFSLCVCCAGANQSTYISCPQGYECLTDQQAQAQFGTANERYSNAWCGYEPAYEILTGKYCYRAKAAAPANGDLALNTNPTGATVTLDGINRGICPVTLSGLTPGVHTARFSLSGFQDQTETVTVVAGQTMRYTFGLSPIIRPVSGTRNGSLAVSSVPSGAIIGVDETLIGYTPLTIRDMVSPGPHHLYLYADGYHDYVQAFSVSSGETVALSVAMVPVSGVTTGPTLVRNPAGNDQVGSESLEEEAGYVALPEDKSDVRANIQKSTYINKINPQPEPPKPEDYSKINPQPEPPRPTSGGILDSFFGLFTGIFGGNRQASSSGMTTAGVQNSSPTHLLGGSSCFGRGIAKCGNDCVDLNNDPDNCGGCGFKCLETAVCSQLKCSYGCSSGETNCDRHCVSLQDDARHCGTCGNACADGQYCAAGMCMARPSGSGAKAVAGQSSNYHRIQIISPKSGDTVYNGQPVQVTWDPEFGRKDDSIVVGPEYDMAQSNIAILANCKGEGSKRLYVPYHVYNTGTYTLPFLQDFRDNIKENGATSFDIQIIGYIDGDGQYSSDTVTLKILDYNQIPADKRVTIAPVAGSMKSTGTLPVTCFGTRFSRYSDWSGSNEHVDTVTSYIEEGICRGGYDDKLNQASWPNEGFTVGYWNYDDNTPIAGYEENVLYRGIVKIDTSSRRTPVSQATLKMHLVGGEMTMGDIAYPDSTAISSIWILQAPYQKFVVAPETPAYEYPSINPTYDPGTGILTWDITAAVNGWIEHPETNFGMMFLGPNEGDNPGNSDRWYAYYDVYPVEISEPLVKK